MDKPLTHNQLKGAQFEGDHWPKRPSREGVASHVGVSKTAITKWRRDPRYKAAIAARRDQRTVEQIYAAVEKEMAQILNKPRQSGNARPGFPLHLVSLRPRQTCTFTLKTIGQGQPSASCAAKHFLIRLLTLSIS
jgi:hypothetical protein